MINLNLGKKGLILFIVGLGLSCLSVYIENGSGGYGSDPKIGDMTYRIFTPRNSNCDQSS